MDGSALARVETSSTAWRRPGRRTEQMRLIPAAALRTLYVKSDRQGAWRTLVHAGLLVAGGVLIQQARDHWWLPAAMLLQGVFVVSLFAAMHECVHYSAFRSRRLNEVVGWMAGLGILFNATYYRYFHFAHHRYAQDPARDPELLTAPPPRSRSEYWWRATGIPYWTARGRNLVSLARGRFDGLDFVLPTVQPEVVRSARTMLVVLAALALGSLVLRTDALVWSWLMPLALGLPFLRLYLLSEHTGCSEDDDGLANTRTTRSVWPVRFLMWNLPYHAEHHLYPSIPFHRLPETHRLLRPHLRVVARGYVAVQRALYASLPIVLLTALALAQPVPAAAQAELLQWVDPTLGKLMGRADYRIQFYSDERVEGQPTRLDLTQHNVTLIAPLFQNSTDEWSASARMRYQNYDTEAVLPDTGERFPQELWDARAGLSYRHKFENQWILGGNVTIGSASDKPFHSEDELNVRATGLLRVPRGERDAWLLSLTYTNDQQIFGYRHLVVPGIAYLWVPSDTFKAVIGVPFTSVEYKPFESFTLEASYFPVRTFRARATYVVFRPLRVFLGFDADHDSYFLADREDKDDQLFYYEKRITAGMRFDLRHVGIELTGGYAFDRFYFEGERYSERHQDKFDVDDGTFVAVRLGFRW